MRVPSERIWPAVSVISIAAAGVSAVMAALSFIDGSIIKAMLSAIAAALFVACIHMSLKIGSRMSDLNAEEDEISCFRLKKPGIERKEEIIPKGKMPKE